MDSKKNTDSQNQDARRGLLEEGARSYVDAMTAVIEYQREVQKICREVLERHLIEYSSALGVKVPQGNIRTFASPKLQAWHGMSADIGVKVVNIARPLVVDWSESCCALQWDFTDPKVKWSGVWVGISLPKKLAGFIKEAMDQVGTKNVFRDAGAVWVVRDLTGDTVSVFDETLDELLCQWIEAWKKVGGFQAILSIASPAAAQLESSPQTIEPA